MPCSGCSALHGVKPNEKRTEGTVSQGNVLVCFNVIINEKISCVSSNLQDFH